MGKRGEVSLAYIHPMCVLANARAAILGLGMFIAWIYVHPFKLIFWLKAQVWYQGYYRSGNRLS